MTQKEFKHYTRLFWLTISPAYTPEEKVKISNDIIMDLLGKNTPSIMLEDFTKKRELVMSNFQLQYDDSTKTIINNIGEEFMTLEKFNNYVEYLVIENLI